MSIFKCKMCGGDLEITPGSTVCECSYCGTQQTLPKLDDDRRANMYDRANHFRRANEFDKAMSMYEKILEEDKTDSEAYWSLVLCRYGIEYVEDPATHKRVPTVNRAQFTSIFMDEDYKSALEYADAYQRAVYEQEATAIDEIQKGILAISQSEEPFDVFICYKETGADGRRTHDSVLANDLYHQLTQEGFKVFFARITLEDKLGQEYEPYIFAALNSAKVMVVLGTKPEHFNAVWVKNEWSRYLMLIKNGAKKTLIPAYRDMDPYDLPEEFSHLQAQDMNKLGFMQDLIRGINKIAQTNAPTQSNAVSETVVVNNNVSSANAAPLLRRAFMFLEDGEWDNAKEYCEKVLDLDPENAEAYVGKMMVDYKIPTKEQIFASKAPQHLKARLFENKLSDNANYKKAIRFADEELKKTLREANSSNNQLKLEEQYDRAKATMANAKTELNYHSAANMFNKVLGFKDASVLAKQCSELAEQTRLETIYSNAKSQMADTDSEDTFRSLAETFKSISSYKDSEQLAEQCIELAESVKVEKAYQNLVSDFNSASNQLKSKAAYSSGLIYDFKRLVNQFAEFRDYKESAEMVQACKHCVIYINAREKAETQDSVEAQEEAIKLFEKTNGYYDSAKRIEDCRKRIEEINNEKKAREEEMKAREAAKKRQKRNNIIAVSIIVAAVGMGLLYFNVVKPNNFYNEAVSLMDEGKYIEALSVLETLGDYKDSVEKADNIKLQLKKDELSKVMVGDYVKFGTYEQDNVLDNGEEEIEWLVLDVKDEKALVISRYGLDCRLYNTSETDVTWETCTLRGWLNNDFINSAFSTAEKTIIPTVTVPADKNPEYSTNPGKATQDQVFLLSITEVNKYFSSDSARQCEPTYYAKVNGVYVNMADDFGKCWWSLRSPGDQQDTAALVFSDGEVDEWGFEVNNDNNAVRPAMWIDFGS